MVSDHGMTHGGNHGGASFEETDALALFIRGREFLKSTHFENRSQVRSLCFREICFWFEGIVVLFLRID